METQHTPQVWQPIETAPKDGAQLILYVVHPADRYAAAVGEPDGWEGVDIGRWCIGLNRWDVSLAGDPTHWMPLPEPPAGKEPA